MLKERASNFFVGNISKELAFFGVDVRAFGKGSAVSDLNLILESSILGVRLGKEVNYSLFKGAERSAIKKGINNAKVLTLVDVDGVLVSQIHIAGEVLRTPEFYKDPLMTVREKGRISFSNLRWLANVVKASGETYLWSSRINLSDENLARNPLLRYAYHLAQDTIDYFPFMGQSTVTKLEKNIGQDKLVVVPGKNTQNSKEAVIKTAIKRINDDYWDLIYLIGSSYFDRRIAVHIAKNIIPSNKLTLFDAGHLIF